MVIRLPAMRSAEAPRPVAAAMVRDGAAGSPAEIEPDDEFVEGTIEGSVDGPLLAEPFASFLSERTSHQLLPATISAPSRITMLNTAICEFFRNVDLRGAFLCTRAVLRKMIQKRYGRIIAISSVSGIAGAPGLTSYTAA